MYENRRRLTSWKEIAAHLGRDVRTVLRWEKDRGLPIHRIGDTGRIVFALVDELDAWARGEVERAEQQVAAPVSMPIPAVGPEVVPLRGSERSRARWWLVAAAVLFFVTVIEWSVRAARTGDVPLTVGWTDDAIVASGPDGAERWRYPFSANQRFEPLVARRERAGEILGGAEPGVLTATATRTRTGDSIVHSGELLWIAPGGAVRRSIAIEDRVTFGTVAYGAPWSITDFRVDPSGGPRRVAVSAHHYEWWPSIVAVFDEGWHRRGTFVNAGWIERMDWVPGNRLLVAGFSNVLDGGMVALLDPDALDGQSPAPPGSSFACTSCGPAGPLRYVVLPRSEVNRASASPFNRALLTVKADSLLVRTIEMTAAELGGPAEALYEFTPSLEVTRASYSDRYWEMHRALETQGKIRHSRAQCPERDGPKEIRVWEPEIGWATVPVTRGVSSRIR